MTIGLALAAAAIFGTGDFLGGLATRQTSGLLVLVISQLIGLVSILCLALGFGGTPAGSDPNSYLPGSAVES